MLSFLVTPAPWKTLKWITSLNVLRNKYQHACIFIYIHNDYNTAFSQSLQQNKKTTLFYSEHSEIHHINLESCQIRRLWGQPRLQIKSLKHMGVNEALLSAKDQIIITSDTHLAGFQLVLILKAFVCVSACGRVHFSNYAFQNLTP